MKFCPDYKQGLDRILFLSNASKDGVSNEYRICFAIAPVLPITILAGIKILPG